MRGCQNGIIQPPCNGRTEICNGGLVLWPSTDNCQNETGLVMTVGLNPLLEEAFTMTIPENHELSSLSITKDYQRKVTEHFRVELQAKPPLEIDTETIKRLIRDFHRSNPERTRQNTAGGTANNVVGFFGLFLWVITFFTFPISLLWKWKKNCFKRRAQPHMMSEIYDKTQDEKQPKQHMELICRVREQNKLKCSAY